MTIIQVPRDPLGGLFPKDTAFPTFDDIKVDNVYTWGRTFSFQESKEWPVDMCTHMWLTVEMKFVYEHYFGGRLKEMDRLVNSRDVRYGVPNFFQLTCIQKFGIHRREYVEFSLLVQMGSERKKVVEVKHIQVELLPNDR